MIGVAGVGLYTVLLFSLAAFVATVIRYELEMGTLVSALIAVGVASAGLMLSLALQVALAVPFLWTFGFFTAVTLLFVVLYELFTRRCFDGAGAGRGNKYDWIFIWEFYMNWCSYTLLDGA